MDNFMKSLVGGFSGSLPMGILFGPVGAVTGFGIGMFSASQGMQGGQGSTLTSILGGAGIGGLCGMIMGNPLGGAVAGGATAGLIALIFGKFGQEQQQTQQCPYYPQPNYNQGYYGGDSTFLIGHPGYGNAGQSYYPGSQAGAYAGNGQAYAYAQQGCYQQQQPPPPNYGGHLSQKGDGKPINYKTSGGWNVEVNGTTITVTDPSGKHKTVHSGDPHEYVDGKRVKDWEGKTRSLILGDGTKITMNATGPQGVIENYSIYDGAESIQINAKGNKIEDVSFDPRQRQWQDANQYDGETAFLGYNNRGQFTYTNIYKQNENLGVTPYYKDLARVGKDNKVQINPDTPNWYFGGYQPQEG